MRGVEVLTITINGKSKESIHSIFANRHQIEGGHLRERILLGDASKDLLCDVKVKIEKHLSDLFDTKNVEVKGLW